MQELIKSSFTTEHISTKIFQKKTESIQKILSASDYQEQVEEGSWTLPTATEICKLTLAEYTSSSPYHNKADHQAVKRFCAKLLATPPENLPSYKRTTQTFEDPTWWEWLYLGLYTYLGPTALKIRREGKKLEKKEKLDTLKTGRHNEYGTNKKVSTPKQTGTTKQPETSPMLKSPSPCSPNLKHGTKSNRLLPLYLKTSHYTSLTESPT
jgi:hypothetical protein